MCSPELKIAPTVPAISGGVLYVYLINTLFILAPSISDDAPHEDRDVLTFGGSDQSFPSISIDVQHLYK